MKISNIDFLTCLLVIATQSTFCQTWPVIYLPEVGSYPLSVEKLYDKGYVIGGEFTTSDGYPIWGLLMKTGINGNLIWYKSLGQNGDGTGIFDVQQTSDHGLIIAGATEQIDSWGDPFIMKLNACGEKEWCRIYSIVNDNFDYTTSVYQIPGGYIAHIYRGSDLFANDHIFLFRLDMNGNLIWQQQYAINDPLFMGAAGVHMIVTPDLKYLINGYCYYPDSGTVSPTYLRPLIIKVDSTGTPEWELPWRYVSGKNFNGMSERSIVDKRQNIYACGRHIEDGATPPGDRPTMLITNPNGHEVSYHDMVPDSWQANLFTINWFSDSTIALGGGWYYSPTNLHLDVFKVDRSGNIIKSKEILSSLYSFADAVVDTDNKLFLVSPQYYNNQWRTYAWKLNSDLEYDTLNTQPRIYDSLCPHAIKSDTIPLDCAVIVGISDPVPGPGTGMLKVYPNPASDLLYIEIPEQLKVSTKNQVFSLTTLYHQWESANLEVYCLFGNKVYTKEIHQTDEDIVIGVSDWPSGMYVVRLVYKGNLVAGEKVIIQ